MGRTIFNVTMLDIADYAVQCNDIKSFAYKADAERYFKELVDNAREIAYECGWYDECGNGADGCSVDTDTTYEIGEPYAWGTSAFYIHLTETTIE